MIVISGALVLVALVLLVLGVARQDLPFVYTSIAVSLVSLGFLVIGILQRRAEPAVAPEGAAPQPERDDTAEGVTAVIPSQAPRAEAVPAPTEQEPAPVADTVEDEQELGGTVLVVAGRPRYHVDGCRYLSGKSAEPVDVLDAREEGYSPCGVCKPDEALAAAERPQAAEQPAEHDEAAEPALPVDGEAVVEEDVPGVEVEPARRAAAGGTRAVRARKAPAAAPEPAPAPAKAARTRTAAPRSTAAPKSAVAPKSTAARKAPAAPAAEVAGSPTKAVKAPSRAAGKAPAASTTRATAAPIAAAPAAATVRAGQVVVIPDRGKFHKPQCRFVRDAADAQVLTKAAAGKQGYTSCGVCKA